jgi:hypothetical protein
MSSKILLLSLGLLNLGACGLFQVDDPTKMNPHVVELTDSDSGCLSREGDLALKYLNGEVSDPQGLLKIWGCVDRALDLFSKRVQGSEKNRYQKEELADFLKTYFFEKPSDFNEELLNHAFVLKTALVGGRKDDLTTEEIKNLRVLLRIFNQQAPRVARFFPLKKLFSKDTNPRTIIEFEALMTPLLADVGRNIDLFGSHYSSSDLRNAFDSLEKIQKRKPSPLKADIQLILESAKEILIAPPSKRILRGQWERLLPGMTSTLIALGQIENYLSRHSNYLCSAALDELELLLTTLRQSWTNLGNPQIDIRRVETLIASIQDPKEFFGLNTNSVLELANVVLRRLSHPDKANYQMDSFGSRELDEWIESVLSLSKLQRKILLMAKVSNPVFRCGPQDSMAVLAGYSVPKSALLKVSDPEHLLFKDIFSTDGVLLGSRENRKVQRSYRDFFEGLLATRPLWTHPEKNFRIAIESKTHPLIQYSVLELSFRAIYWTFHGRIFQSYGTSQVDSNGLVNRLLVDDFHELYLNTRNFGVEKAFYDPSTTNAAILRHRESDLFMPTSNGNLYMELGEAVDLFLGLMSGRNFAVDLHEELMKYCKSTSDVDFTGFPMILGECLFKETFGSYLPKLEFFFPQLSQFFSEQDFDQQTYMLENLSRMFMSGNEGSMASYVITEKLAALIQFEELLFRRFDTDFSGAISRREMDPLYDLLSKTLEVATQQKSGLRRKAILAFLFQNGQLPTDGNMIGMKFLWYEQHPAEWSFQAKRGRVFEVFRILAEAVAKTKTPAPSKSVEVNKRP